MANDHVDITLQPGTMNTQSGRVVRYSQEDIDRRYLTDQPTPEKFATLMKDVDDGDIAAMVEMNQEMEAKDIHLQEEAAKRRGSLTALDWTIEAAESKDDQALADEAAALCQETLDGIDSFEASLAHLATAIGPNISATELIWEKGALIDTQDIGGWRLQSVPQFSPEVLLITDENPWPGEQMPPGKFVVHTPNPQAGFPMRVTLTRALGWIYLIKRFAIADWAAFSEKFGTPTVVAFRNSEATSGQGDALKVMLQDMTADTWAVVQDVDDIKMLDSAKSDGPHPALIEWAEKKQTLAYLGQTLTTDTQGVGSLALGQVHANVRADLTLTDMKAEARTIQQQVLRPIVTMGFPKKDVPLPLFKRKIVEAKNIEEGRLSLDQLRASVEFGLQVDDSVKYDMLGLPQPKAQVTTAEVADKTPEPVETDSE